MSICPQCNYELTTATMHGWVNSLSQGQIPCPTCTPAAKQAEREQRASALLANARIPRRCLPWSFASCPPQNAAFVQKVKAFAAAKEKRFYGLYLQGKTGSGKTGLAISYLKASIEQGIPSLFVSSADLFRCIKASIARGTDEGDTLLEALRTTERVVIDDIGVEKPSAYVLEHLYILVNHRHNELLETVFTSNLSLDQLKAYWGTAGGDDPLQMLQGLRIIERLAEYCYVMEVTGANHRAGA